MHTRSKGNLGEDIACKFIEKQGFSVITRNYQKKWGEIDIIAHKIGSHGKMPGIHFFEVKSVTGYFNTAQKDIFRPEDNVHELKLKHIGRMVETYFAEFMPDRDVSFEFHVICVYMNMKTRRANIKWLKNIIL